MLVVDPRENGIVETRVRDLPSYVSDRDTIAVNDAATLPASLHGTTAEGQALETRLVASHDAETWRAVVFGAGDWRTRTEERAEAPHVREGDVLTFHGDLTARVTHVIEPRLVELRFDGTADHFWSAVYRHGRPIQYAHVAAPLALWHVQTPFASRPWASEMPSAARPLAWELVLALRAKGVRFARVTHAAGLSSTGDARLDAMLPLRESFEVDAEAVGAIDAARANDGRVIAIGTSAARAVESAALNRPLVPARGETDLLLGPSHPLRAVDAVLTGLHDVGTTHATLLEAFAPRALLDRARRLAESRGFLGHEFGDSMLVLPGALAGRG
jgi:S-adenosylmethionine:tRNA ribosyltransferase-isomerase